MPEAQWAALSTFVAANLGLHFPRNRYQELRRGMEKAALDYGFDDLGVCIPWLLGQSPVIERLAVLARHLTIGETYFFRDLQALEVLSSEVLAPLVAARARGGRYLRLWSAGCSTGEEAYTLAILLHRLIPDIANWNIAIMATDINTQSLRKAEAATYGEWSFRSAPPWLKSGYFERNAQGRYTVVPHIRRMVRFGLLNLADAPEAAQGVDVRGMDVILCRHVLMYFEASKAPQAAGHLHACLLAGGWLVTSACEASPQLFPGFDAVTHSGAVLMRRRDALSASPPAWNADALGQAGTGRYVQPTAPAHQDTAAPSTVVTVAAKAPARPPAAKVASPVRERATGAMKQVTPVPVPTTPHDTHPAAEVRALANQGRLADALEYCERLLARNKLDASSHYLRAMILLEMGLAEEAEAALHKALYVEPEFALAHFAKGQLAQTRHAPDVARRHFRRALDLLGRRRPEDVIAESDGVTVGALVQTLKMLLAQEHVA